MENTNSMTITNETTIAFKNWLHAEERSEGTIAKYMRDLNRFSDWMNGREISKELLTELKNR